MKRLHKLLVLTPLAAALLPAAAAAATSDEINSLRERLNQLEAQMAQQKEDVKKASSGVYFGDTKFKFGGYVKLDAMYSRFSDGSVGGTSSARDFYVPSATPVSNGTGKASDSLDFTAQQSRFNFTTETPAGDGKVVKSFFELDFQSPNRGTRRVTNNYDPGLRHAFISYDKWLFGQTWTTFQDLGALPETVEFVGSSEGTTFGRQPQVRYTNGAWQVAVESSETAVGGASTTTAPDCTGIVAPAVCPSKTTTSFAVNDSGGNTMPDLVVRYTHKMDSGHITAAAIGRQLEAANAKAGEGYGLTISGKHKFSNGDDIRFMATHGKGIGRYVALGTAPDAVVDASGELDGIETTNGYVTYRHMWTDKLRSNLQASYFTADNPAALAANAAINGSVTEKVVSGLTNVIYNITPKLEVGLEYLHAKRTVENGNDGSLDRFQFMAKHSF